MQSLRKGALLFPGMTLRTIVYVDGFNLYYGSLKGTPYKWLDLAEYFRKTLPKECTLVKVKYFTAKVSPLPNDLDAPKRQDVYLRALRAHSGAAMEIIEGHFLIKNKRAPLRADPTRIVEIIQAEEKGSDVNLAVELVNDAWLNAFDCAAVVSNDGDLARALKIAKQHMKKRVILYTPGAPTRKPLAVLRSWSHRQIDIRPADLAASQLPDPIAGTAITKPAKWV